MNRQIFYLLTFVVIIVEFIQLSNTHRLVKIRKFYRPNKPWRPKIQRLLRPYVQKYVFTKKPPWRLPHHPQQYRPIHSSHRTAVEIQFPRRMDDNGWWENPNSWTNNRNIYSYDPHLIGEDNDHIKRESIQTVYRLFYMG